MERTKLNLSGLTASLGVGILIGTVGVGDRAIYPVEVNRLKNNIKNNISYSANYTEKAIDDKQINNKQKEPICAKGYRRFTSVHGNYCVEDSRNDFDNTPIDLIESRSYQYVRYKDVKCSLDKIIIGEQVALRSRALGEQDVKEAEEPKKLGVIWPIATRVKTNWGSIANVLCEGTRCEWDKVGNRGEWWLTRVLNWRIPVLITNKEFYYSSLTEKKENKIVSLGDVPSVWFYGKRLGDLVRYFGLEQEFVGESGDLYPTAGQLNNKIYQVQLVGQAGISGRNRLDLRLINVNESDETRPQDRKGQGEIVTGTNRAVKAYCDATDRSQGYSPCAFILAQNTAGMFFLLINGSIEYLNLKRGGGGDRIVANTEVVNNPIRSGSLGRFVVYPQDFSNGDFRTDEIIGSTNDIPNIRNIGNNIDGCDFATRGEILPYLFTGSKISIRSYVSKPCIGIREPGVRYVKQAILFRAETPDVPYLAQIERKCVERQIYQQERCIDGANQFCAIPNPNWRVTVCRGIPKLSKQQLTQGVKQGQIAQRAIRYGEVFPWTIRPGLPILKGR